MINLYQFEFVLIFIYRTNSGKSISIKSISIKSDLWIPSISGFKSCANNLYNVADHSLKVSTLITNAGCWNDIEVRHLFPHFEAESILDIPLNHSGCEDLRFWNECSKDIYC